MKRRHWWMFILIFLCSQLAAGITPFLLSLLHIRLSSSITLVGTLLLANLLAIGLFFLYRPHSITWTSTMAGLQGQAGRRTFWVFLMAIPAILLVNILQEALFPDIPDLVGADTFKEIMYHPAGLLTIMFLGPLSEELLFRGGVQTDLAIIMQHEPQSRFRSTYSPLILSALIFAIIHLNPAQMPAVFILGFVLGFAYWWTGSLLAPVCIHVFNNSLACLLYFLSPDDDSFIHFVGGATNAGVIVLTSLVALGLIIWQMYRLSCTKSISEER